MSYGRGNWNPKWARKPKAEKKPVRPTVLLATTITEYQKLCREYPNMKVRLDTSHQEQRQLFDTGGLTDGS